MLEKFDVHLTDHCNLNCKGCTHFSPLAEPFYLSVEEFERDMTRMAELSQGKVKQIFLLGGEPLLHPQVTAFLPIARRLFPETRVIIITNGILVSAQTDSFWQCCKDNKIEIWVSEYNLNLHKAENEAKAREYGVFYGYTTTGNNEQNVRNWSKIKFDLEGKQYWIDSFEHCQFKKCVTLKHGKLYTCCVRAHFEHFNKCFGQNLELSEFDCVDIYKVKSFQTVLDTMVKPTPFCRYCRTREYEACYWEPSKKDISEWT